MCAVGSPAANNNMRLWSDSSEGDKEKETNYSELCNCYYQRFYLSYHCCFSVCLQYSIICTVV